MLIGRAWRWAGRAAWYVAAWPIALVAVPLTCVTWILVEFYARARTLVSRRAHDELIMDMDPKDAVWEPKEPSSAGCAGWDDAQTIITALLVVDSLSLAELRAMVAASLVDARTPDGGLRYPRFSRRVRRRGGGCYTWVEHAPLSIEKHVALAPAWVRDEASAHRRAGELASGAELRYDQPLWRFELAESMPGGTSAVLLQMHHSMADGIALVQVLLEMMDKPEREEGVPSAQGAAPGHVGARALVGALAFGRVLLEGPLIALRALLRPRASGALAARPSGRKLAACARSVPLQEVRAIGRATRCSVNDVLASSVAAAMRARELELGTPEARLPRHAVAVVPINTRRAGQAVAMENEFAVLFVPLPCAQPLAPVARLQRTHAELWRIKESVEPHAMALAARLIHRLLPAPLNKWVVDYGADRAHLVLSTLPGPQKPVAWAGKAVRAVRFWSPTRAQVCVTASAFSYAGSVELCVQTDAAADDDPAALCRLFLEAFEQLRADALGSGGLKAQHQPPAAAVKAAPGVVQPLL